jgi:hypothetical protein
MEQGKTQTLLILEHAITLLQVLRVLEQLEIELLQGGKGIIKMQVQIIATRGMHQA